MTEITLTLDIEDPRALVDQIHRRSPGWSEGAGKTPAAKALRALAAAIAEQLPKPVTAEPTGDVAVFRSGWFYRPGSLKGWMRDDLVPFSWSEVVGGEPHDLAVYRRVGDEYDPLLQQVRDLLFRSPSGTLTHEEIGSAYKAVLKGLTGILTDTPQSDATGALPTSPSPEVGVATSPPVASPATDAYSRGYEDGAESNLPSPVDRSNIISALRESIAKISMREESLIGEAHSYELADAVMKSLSGGTSQANLDESVAYSNGYEKGAAEQTARIRTRIQALRDAAITAPEQAQLDNAIRECR